MLTGPESLCLDVQIAASDAVMDGYAAKEGIRLACVYVYDSYGRKQMVRQAGVGGIFLC